MLRRLVPLAWVLLVSVAATAQEPPAASQPVVSEPESAEAPDLSPNTEATQPAIEATPAATEATPPVTDPTPPITDPTPPVTLEDLGETHGWEEIPEPVAEQQQVQQLHRASSDALSATPRGWIFAARLDVDAWVPSDLGSAAALEASWAGRTFGASIAVLSTWPIGLRAEARAYLFRRSPVRPYLGIGVTTFVPDVGLRVAGGMHWELWRQLGVVVDVAYERYLSNREQYRDNGLFVGTGVFYNLQ